MSCGKFIIVEVIIVGMQINAGPKRRLDPSKTARSKA